jgi:hypothetical protein
VNLLLVTYSFPPAAGVGVLRAFSLAKYLPGNGVRVDVLTARNAAAVGQDSGRLAELSAAVRVHRTWTLDLPFSLRKAIKQVITRPTVTSSSNMEGTAGGGWKATLKRLIGNLLLPDPQVGWLPFALPVARRLIRSRSIDAVLITVPPFSSVRLVTRLRRHFPALPIVLDFRDEWLTTTLRLVSFNSNDRARNVAERAEREAVHAATLVVCVTEAAVTELQRRYPNLPAEHFACIPNGFDIPIQAPVLHSIGPGSLVTLTYIGTIYNSTDPTPMVEAILAMPAALRQRLRLRFIGHIEAERYRQVLERLGNQVEFLGFLPQAEALAHMETTDYLLLITHDPVNVAAKLYDYIASGVPILAAVHPQGDVRKVLEQTRTGRVADIGDRDAIEFMLTEALTAPAGSTYVPNRAAIETFQRSALTARYASLLQSLLPGEPA